jgi:hypothetical protein
MVMLVLAVQPCASVTVYVYVPATSVNEPVPTYGVVPPSAVTVTVAFPPLHRTSVAIEEAVRVAGSEIVMVVEDVHPFASVTL